jgi:hypothetical protein
LLKSERNSLSLTEGELLYCPASAYGWVSLNKRQKSLIGLIAINKPEQIPRLLHLEFLAVKTPKKGSKCGANLWLKSSGATLPRVRGFCNSKKSVFPGLNSLD